MEEKPVAKQTFMKLPGFSYSIAEFVFHVCRDGRSQIQCEFCLFFCVLRSDECVLAHRIETKYKEE